MTDNGGSKKLPGFQGIEVPADVASTASIPEDLDAYADEVYWVPSTQRRRSAGLFYVGGAVLIAVGALAGLPTGYWAVVVALAVIGVYHIATAWPLHVREGQALDIANRAVPFGVGHASAQLAFGGWLAKPVWHLLVFADDDPPSKRALVRISPFTGDVLDTYVEDTPA